MPRIAHSTINSGSVSANNGAGLARRVAMTMRGNGYGAGSCKSTRCVWAVNRRAGQAWGKRLTTLYRSANGRTCALSGTIYKASVHCATSPRPLRSALNGSTRTDNQLPSSAAHKLVAGPKPRRWRPSYKGERHVERVGFLMGVHPEEWIEGWGGLTSTKTFIGRPIDGDAGSEG